MFTDHLTQFIFGMRSEGHEVILAVDTNENSIDGTLAKALSRIELVEVFYRKFKRAGPASYARGWDHIDSVWSSSITIPTNIALILHMF